MGSNPAAAQSARSRRWVPLSSPRETKGASAAAILASAAAASSAPAIPAGSPCGAHHDEVVVHQVEARAAVARRNERLFGGLVVHQEEVGIAVPRKPQRLAGADRDDAHLDPGLGLEQRQQTVEEAGVLGGRGRGDGDEVAGARCRHCQHDRERRCRQPGNDAARAGASARGKGSHARRSRVA